MCVHALLEQYLSNQIIGIIYCCTHISSLPRNWDMVWNLPVNSVEFLFSARNSFFGWKFLFWPKIPNGYALSPKVCVIPIQRRTQIGDKTNVHEENSEMYVKSDENVLTQYYWVIEQNTPMNFEVFVNCNVMLIQAPPKTNKQLFRWWSNFEFRVENITH